jgi:hypothetical protein
LMIALAEAGVDSCDQVFNCFFAVAALLNIWTLSFCGMYWKWWTRSFRYGTTGSIIFHRVDLIIISPFWPCLGNFYVKKCRFRFYKPVSNNEVWHGSNGWQSSLSSREWRSAIFSVFHVQN